ncbi:MAG: DinB family protein [Bacteroidia bacterium]
MKITLLKLAKYNQWANKVLVSHVKTQTPELLEKPIGSSFETIKKTFMHIADAEHIWYSRLTDTPADKLPTKLGIGIEAVAYEDQKMIDFIESKDDAYFAQSTTYKTIKGDPFTNNNFAILTHLFNHSTFHRGQIVTMIRNSGFTGHIESTDFISYERL